MDWKPSWVPVFVMPLFLCDTALVVLKVELEKHNCRYIGSFTQAVDFNRVR